MNTIQQGFDDYATNCIPSTASEIQMTETRRAFYAGAMAMLKITMAVGNSDMSEKAGAAVLEGVYQEISQFANDVVTDQA